MNDKKLTLGLLLVIGIGLTALPMAAAQDFGGGDSSNNEDESSSGGNFGGGDSTNNEDESSSEDGDFGGGDSGNNEDESNFGGGDSSNNDDSSGTEDTEDSDDSEEDSESSETVSESRTSGEVHVITALSPANLQAELSSDAVPLGEEVTASGQLTIDENDNRTIEVLLNSTQETSSTTDGNGEFSSSFTPSEAGSYTVTLDVAEEDLSRDLELEVISGISIGSLTTSGETRAGQPIEVCAEMASSGEVDVTLYHNNQEFATSTGEGQICFNPVLESGTNTFRAVASSNGETDEAIVSRNTGSTGDPGTDNGATTTAPTGGFLGSPTARVAAVGTLLVAIALAVVVIARRRGALRTP